MEKKLTRRQMETLEAVYHQGNPYLKKCGPRDTPKFVDMGIVSRAGGAIRRMIDQLEREGYITDGWPRKLTMKGLKAVRDDKIAMMGIAPAEIESRIEKRKQLDAVTEETRRIEREHREEERAARQVRHRAERLGKLHDLLDGFDCVVFSDMDDDKLLDLASKVANIEGLY